MTGRCFGFLIVSLIALLIGGCGGGSTLGGGVATIEFVPNFLAADVTASADAGPGTTFDGHTLCCDGLNVYTAWVDNRNTDGNVFLNYSRDGGLTWLANDILISDANADAFNAPVICCDANYVYVAWTDGRSGMDQVYANGSDDFGVTWRANDVRVDNNPGVGSTNDVQICCAGRWLFASWEDTRNGPSDIYFNTSPDAGGSWQLVDERLNTNPAGESESLRPRMCCSSTRISVIWEDERNDAGDVIRDIYVNSSFDAGFTWLANDVRLDTDAAGANMSINAAICCEGLYVYAVWQDRRNSTGTRDDIYFNWSPDGGQSWQLVDNRVDSDVAGSAASRFPAICCEGDNVYVVWEDDRLVDTDICLNFSRDQGTNWQAGDRLIETDGPGSADSHAPVICCDGSNVLVGWLEERNGVPEAFMNYSVNSGQTFSGDDVRIETDVAGANAASGLRICCGGGAIHCLWSEDRGTGAALRYTGSLPGDP